MSTLFDVIVTEDNLLVCPTCNETYLHQQNTTIFERHEDEEITTVIAQNDRTVQVSDFRSEDTCNPSHRRHGMLIEFKCEHCHNWGADGPSDEYRTPHRLAIYQHKGNTFMEWQVG